MRTAKTQIRLSNLDKCRALSEYLLDTHIIFMVTSCAGSNEISHKNMGLNDSAHLEIEWSFARTLSSIRESPPQSETRIMAPVYERSITCKTMYKKAPFCWTEPSDGKLVL